MLATYRRHQIECKHRAEGRSYRCCQCVIWVDGTLAGMETRKSLHTRDWQKAQGIVREWEAEGRDTLKAKESNVPIMLDQAWQSFLSDMEARNLNVSTVRKYRLLSRRMKDFAARRGFRFLAEINLVELRAFFRFAQDSKWVEDNPASKLKTPKVTQRPTLPFTHEEMLRILAARDPFYNQIAPSGRDSARRLRASVYTVLPGFVVRALDVIPRVTPTHFFWNGTDSFGWSRWELVRKTTRTVPACKSDKRACSQVQRYFCRRIASGSRPHRTSRSLTRPPECEGDREVLLGLDGNPAAPSRRRSKERLGA
jgi:hypothetical protein